MLRAALGTNANDDVFSLLRLNLKVLLLLAAGLHATVKIVPVVAELLNFTVKESPLLRVSAEP